MQNVWLSLLLAAPSPSPLFEALHVPRSKYGRAFIITVFVGLARFHPFVTLASSPESTANIPGKRDGKGCARGPHNHTWLT